MLLMVVWGLACAATPVFLIRREMGSVHASDVGEGHVTLGPVTVRVPGVWSDLLSPRSLPDSLGVFGNA